MLYLHVHMCTLCMPGAQGGQKITKGLLEVELQTPVSCYVGAGNQTRALKEQLLTNEPSPASNPDFLAHLLVEGSIASLSTLNEAIPT